MILPFFRSASAWYHPAAIAFTSLTPGTATGTSRLSQHFASWASPSCPESSAPHATTVLFFSSAILKFPPAATAITSFRPFPFFAEQGGIAPTAHTATGLLLHARPPSHDSGPVNEPFPSPTL